ncbi:MAG: hypothetical protein U0269_06005 [Polyangiales bacterium]
MARHAARTPLALVTIMALAACRPPIVTGYDRELAERRASDERAQRFEALSSTLHPLVAHEVLATLVRFGDPADARAAIDRAAARLEAPTLTSRALVANARLVAAHARLDGNDARATAALRRAISLADRRYIATDDETAPIEDARSAILRAMDEALVDAAGPNAKALMIELLRAPRRARDVLDLSGAARRSLDDPRAVDWLAPRVRRVEAALERASVDELARDELDATLTLFIAAEARAHAGLVRPLLDRLIAQRGRGPFARDEQDARQIDALARWVRAELDRPSRRGRLDSFTAPVRTHPIPSERASWPSSPAVDHSRRAVLDALLSGDGASKPAHFLAHVRRFERPEETLARARRALSTDASGRYRITPTALAAISALGELSPSAAPEPLATLVALARAPVTAFEFRDVDHSRDERKWLIVRPPAPDLAQLRARVYAAIARAVAGAPSLIEQPALMQWLDSCATVIGEPEYEPLRMVIHGAPSLFDQWMQRLVATPDGQRAARSIAVRALRTAQQTLETGALHSLGAWIAYFETLRSLARWAIAGGYAEEARDAFSSMIAAAPRATAPQLLADGPEVCAKVLESSQAWLDR